MTSDVRHTLEAVFALESTRILAALARQLRDLDLAEQILQDAFVEALEQWPRRSLPEQPGAWLMAAARRRAIDALRREGRLQRAVQGLGHDDGDRADDPALHAENELGDAQLGLLFTCCHPSLPREGQTALVLRLLGGLSVPAIARAYLVPDETIAQRIVRAKRTLQAEPVAFELPGAHQRQARLATVLEVVYLIFNEGYAAAVSKQWFRHDLCAEALRLSRALMAHLPREAEVHGLAALLELQASRLRARTDPHGEPILLQDQDRQAWDHLAIQRGFAALASAQQLAPIPGPYALQAEIAACHARAPSAAATDWPRIVALYGRLLDVAPSPVVALNRAYAVSMAYGAAAGLVLVDDLRDELGDYPPWHGVRGDLLVRLDRRAEARREFESAAAATRNERERALMLRRAAACGAATP